MFIMLHLRRRQRNERKSFQVLLPFRKVVNTQSRWWWWKCRLDLFIAQDRFDPQRNPQSPFLLECQNACELALHFSELNLNASSLPKTNKADLLKIQAHLKLQSVFPSTNQLVPQWVCVCLRRGKSALGDCQVPLNSFARTHLKLSWRKQEFLEPIDWTSIDTSNTLGHYLSDEGYWWLVVQANQTLQLKSFIQTGQTVSPAELPTLANQA